MLMEWASLIPDQASYRLHWQQLQDALALVTAALPGCRATAELSSELKAYQSRAWGGIACPSCREPLSIHWWRGRTFDAERQGEAALVVALPCCGAEHSINELYFASPQGLAYCAIKIARDRQSDEDKTAMDAALAAIEPAVAVALGCGVRRVVGGF